VLIANAQVELRIPSVSSFTRFGITAQTFLPSKLAGRWGHSKIRPLTMAMA
jgi:hypothetical protein